MCSKGKVEGIINLNTSDLFEIEQISVTLWDKACHLLEKDGSRGGYRCAGWGEHF